MKTSARGKAPHFATQNDWWKSSSSKTQNIHLNGIQHQLKRHSCEPPICFNCISRSGRTSNVKRSHATNKQTATGAHLTPIIHLLPCIEGARALYSRIMHNNRTAICPSDAAAVDVCVGGWCANLWAMLTHASCEPCVVCLLCIPKPEAKTTTQHCNGAVCAYIAITWKMCAAIVHLITTTHTKHITSHQIIDRSSFLPTNFRYKRQMVDLIFSHIPSAYTFFCSRSQVWMYVVHRESIHSPCTHTYYACIFTSESWRFFPKKGDVYQPKCVFLLSACHTSFAQYRTKRTQDTHTQKTHWRMCGVLYSVWIYVCHVKGMPVYILLFFFFFSSFTQCCSHYVRNLCVIYVCI